MFRVINWTATLLGWALVCYGVQALVFSGAGAYLVASGHLAAGDALLFGVQAPELWEGVEDAAGGLVSVVLGLGLRALVRMRVASRLDDLARGNALPR